MTPTCFLILPGWQGADPNHWQSLWAQRPGCQQVEQDDWRWPRRGDWMANLEEAVLAKRLNAEPSSTQPERAAHPQGQQAVVLVARGLGCHLVARWASHSQHAHRVAAALLVAPADIEQPDMPPQLQAWGPIVNSRLPFASTVVASDNDPFATLPRQQQMASQWGSAFELLHSTGPLNSASGLGDWPDGLALLHALCDRAGVAGPAFTGR